MQKDSVPCLGAPHFVHTAACAAAGASCLTSGAAAAGSASSFAPHMTQNFAPSSSAAPQFGQIIVFSPISFFTHTIETNAHNRELTCIPHSDSSGRKKHMMHKHTSYVFCCF
jgi:hypothetical protein